MKSKVFKGLAEGRGKNRKVLEAQVQEKSISEEDSKSMFKAAVCFRADKLLGRYFSLWRSKFEELQQSPTYLDSKAERVKDKLAVLCRK